jgi:hypothetical protein
VKQKFRLALATLSTPKQTRRHDPRIVENQQIAGTKK